MGNTDDLRSYYEEEARIEWRQSPSGRRVELRDQFLKLLSDEGRRTVVDLGAGPGGDGQAFTDAGHHYVGLDLAHGNGVLARRDGLTVLQGSIGAPPFRPGAFDAGWSMSTLMHIPTEQVEATLAATAKLLQPGAPLLIGLWGGERRDLIDEKKIAGQRRLFSLRPLDLNRKLIATCGTIEFESRWDSKNDGEEYQVFRLRTRP
ncbi:MAG: class I SAM-dependent methyltransferase [Acidimicrobiales bacterium]